MKGHANGALTFATGDDGYVFAGQSPAHHDDGAVTAPSPSGLAEMLVRHTCRHCHCRIAIEDFERETAAAQGFCSRDCSTMYHLCGGGSGFGGY